MRPLGPDGRPDGPWGSRGVPRGSEHESCTNTGQSSDLSDDYKLRAALEGTHFFSAKLTFPLNLTYLLVLLQLAKRLCPFKLYRNYVQEGTVDSKSYRTIVKTHRDETSQVTDLSPGSSRSENVRH